MLAYKELNKRLSLRKTTISNLNSYEMDRVFGGNFDANSNPCVFTPACPPTTGCPITGGGNSVCICGSTTTVTVGGL
jgi:natural product precursor